MISLNGRKQGHSFTTTFSFTIIFSSAAADAGLTSPAILGTTTLLTGTNTLAGAAGFTFTGCASLMVADTLGRVASFVGHVSFEPALTSSFTIFASFNKAASFAKFVSIAPVFSFTAFSSSTGTLTFLLSAPEKGWGPKLTTALPAFRAWEALFTFKESPISVADVSPSLIRATSFSSFEAPSSRTGSNRGGRPSFPSLARASRSCMEEGLTVALGRGTTSFSSNTNFCLFSSFFLRCTPLLHTDILLISQTLLRSVIKLGK